MEGPAQAVYMVYNRGRLIGNKDFMRTMNVFIKEPEESAVSCRRRTWDAGVRFWSEYLADMRPAYGTMILPSPEIYKIC
jgi:hypothetical protein